MTAIWIYYYSQLWLIKVLKAIYKKKINKTKPKTGIFSRILINFKINKTKKNKRQRKRKARQAFYN